MKRLIALLLACLLLTACTSAPIEETTEPPQTEQTTLPAVDPTEPSGAYDPQSKVEAQTNGAVRTYHIDISDVYGFSCMGEDILIFSGSDQTTLTRLSGENLFVTAKIVLDSFIYPELCSVNVSEKGISYYEESSREIVMLNTELQEYSRVQLPEDILGQPILTENRKFAYYCTADAVREISLESGLSRILKEVNSDTTSVEALLLNDTVLCCNMWDEDYRFVTIFLSVENGQILWEGEADFYVEGNGETWFAITSEGMMTGFVYADADGNEKMLIPTDYTANGTFIASEKLLVIEIPNTDTQGITLECYDLSSGKRISSFTTDDESYVSGLTAQTGTHFVYFFGDDFASEEHTLYRWDVDALATGDENDYSCDYFTKTNPDEDGLAQCRDYAQQIGDTYGVKIHVGEEATYYQPWDYDMEAEYQVPVVWESLESIERLLSVFPEGMLREAASDTADGYIHISIVRTLMGSAETGSLNTADGIHFFSGDDSYIALAAGIMMEQTFYHEMFHALETRLLSASSALYDWEYLNPDGFEYDYDYVQNQSREDFEYLDNENRYFIDMYSMSFPKEDRARVFEYAMYEYGDEYFTSEPMQAKLLAICKAIRKAYGLKKYESELPWEQYLTESLAYTK